MQMLTIQEQGKKDTILEAISDKYSRIILETTMNKPKTALEISIEHKIPISTVYRRLQTLHDAKLLAISGSISDEGKRYFMYKCKIRQITTAFNGNAVDVFLVPK
ncbi:MAG: helix-turn-helix domain-containing protein [Thermoproteota archaeon]|jgi:predicted transcriptional regulator